MYRNKFIHMPTQFEGMQDGHLGSMKSVQHRIQLDKTDSQPLGSAHNEQGQKARKF